MRSSYLFLGWRLLLAFLTRKNYKRHKRCYFQFSSYLTEKLAMGANQSTRGQSKTLHFDILFSFTVSQILFHIHTPQGGISRAQDVHQSQWNLHLSDVHEVSFHARSFFHRSERVHRPRKGG